MDIIPAKKRARASTSVIVEDDNTADFWKEKFEAEKRRNEELELKLQEIETENQALKSLFRKEQIRGGCYSYTKQLKRLVVMLTAEGEAATSIHRFLSALSDVFPEFLNHSACSVPSYSFINRLQDEFLLFFFKYIKNIVSFK